MIHVVLDEKKNLFGNITVFVLDVPDNTILKHIQDSGYVKKCRVYENPKERYFMLKLTVKEKLLKNFLKDLTKAENKLLLRGYEDYEEESERILKNIYGEEFLASNTVPIYDTDFEDA